jgi:hypothetical protein
MILKQIPAILVLSTAVLMSCQSHKVAREVAALRRSSDLTAARDLAINSLRASAKDMELWRELAATDLAIFAKAESLNAEPVSYLLEVALLCASVYAHDSGASQEQWQAMGRRVAVEALTLSNRMLDDLPRTEVISKHVTERFADPNIPRELQRQDYIITTQSRHDWITDIPIATKVIRQSSALLEYTQRLPQENAALMSTIQGVDSHINSLPRFISNLSSSLIDDNRQQVQRAVTARIDAATTELQVHGHFTLATIQQDLFADPS